MHAFVQSLPVDEHGDGFIVKKSTSRDLIMQLPFPVNVERRAEIIPAAPVKLFLSTTSRLPEFIKRMVRQSETPLFQDDSVFGICLNGRGLPVEIFLHENLILQTDPSGNLFDETGWHELTHGTEGIECTPDGKIIRHEPWSFSLQQEFLRRSGDDSAAPWKSKYDIQTQKYIQYLRAGAKLQENVSELFARFATIYMLRIRNSGYAPTANDIIDPQKRKSNPSREDREGLNLHDALIALLSYSEDCDQLFVDSKPEMVARIAALYGCVPS